MKEMLEAAKAAKKDAASLSGSRKMQALMAMAQALKDGQAQILEANQKDMERAAGSISPVMLDRLMLNPQRISAMAEGIRNVAALPDPTGRTLASHLREDGLKIEKISVPIGVIAIIYESRPNVTSDAAALTLKSGNVCILRSGKEAFFSVSAITALLRESLQSIGLNPNLINLVPDTSHAGAKTLMTAEGYVDLLIPRGGAGLIRACMEQATVPCIQTGTGICHIYVEKSADPEMALNIIENAKTSRPSVCNAMEVLLIDRELAPTFLPRLYTRLTDRAQPVQFRLDDFAHTVIPGQKAGPSDYDTEFLNYILAVRCVEGPQEAIAHIAAHSTGHSEAILSQNQQAIAAFTQQVDSAAVYVNASTRFTDGGEFGLGCEMGISTQKLHARGPMGLQELTTYKYIIHGNGQMR